jgi:V/A-type H+-transporting ATPase subunit D
MSDETPTRSRLMALADERRAMREGYAFLDEKCLLLAGEMLRLYRRAQALRAALAPLQREARAALAAALARHGLHGLAVVPAAGPGATVKVETRALLGVGTVQARLSGSPQPAAPAVFVSDDAERLRAAYARLAAPLVELAGTSTTLSRLLAEYRRTVRRVRALQDVLLPELDTAIADIDASLEDLEREDAVALRVRRT